MHIFPCNCQVALLCISVFLARLCNCFSSPGSTTRHAIAQKLQNLWCIPNIMSVFKYIFPHNWNQQTHPNQTVIFYMRSGLLNDRLKDFRFSAKAILLSPEPEIWRIVFRQCLKTKHSFYDSVIADHDPNRHYHDHICREVSRETSGAWNLIGVPYKFNNDRGGSRMVIIFMLDIWSSLCRMVIRSSSYLIVLIIPWRKLTRPWIKDREKCFYRKHRKNCECCPVSQLIVR